MEFNTTVNKAQHKSARWFRFAHPCRTHLKSYTQTAFRSFLHEPPKYLRAQQASVTIKEQECLALDLVPQFQAEYAEKKEV